MKFRFVLVTGLAMILPWLAGCGGGEKELPSRDEIPRLRQRLFALEEGLRSENRAALDSLLSPKALRADQDADSLLDLIYGPDGSFPFYRLGDYEIFFGGQVGVITCYIMDSTQTPNRPITLTYERRDTLWLLQKFETGPFDTTGGEW